MHAIFGPGNNCFCPWLTLVFPTQVGFEKQVFQVCLFSIFIFHMIFGSDLRQDANIVILMQDSLITIFAANNFTAHM